MGPVRWPRLRIRDTTAVSNSDHMAGDGSARPRSNSRTVGSFRLCDRSNWPHGNGVLVRLMGPSSAGFMYADTGGSGPPVVFLHGVLMNGTLWNDIVDRMRDRYWCIVPELPFGAHRTPMPDDADLTLESLVKMNADFLWWARRSVCRRGRIHGSWSPISRRARPRPSGCTRSSTARVGRWRTVSGSSSSTCLPTAPAHTRCGRTSCGCTSPSFPTRLLTPSHKGPA